VPRALDEAGLLDQFITDVYASPAIRQIAHFLPSPWDEKLAHRHDPSLSGERVRSLWGTTLWEWIRHAAGHAGAKTYAAIDPVYSRVAAQRAQVSRSHLLLYTPYAWEAFTTTYPHSPRRILFQYHPHAAYERGVLQEDAQRWSQLNFDFEDRAETGEGLTEAQQHRTEAVWRHADRIFCASSFTKQTVVDAGAPADQCVVIPYGVDLPVQPEEVSATPSTFNVLFVGSGIQRKGLHHLLHAWTEANLPPESHLTLVCRVLDPVLEALIEDTPHTTLHQGVSFDTLLSLYRSHTLFAMPSLIEGFGQVYLEAMSQGCPVLGTNNTCLPDLGGEEEGVFIVESGNQKALTSRLEELAFVLPSDATYRLGARKCASWYTWNEFRTSLRDALP